MPGPQWKRKQAYNRRKARRTTVGKKRKAPVRRRGIPRGPGTMTVVKAHKFAGHDDMSLFGTAPGGGESYDPKEWYFFSPLTMNRVSNAAPSEKDRQSDNIFAKNTRAEFQFIPSKRCIQGIQIRACYGYFKGDDNVGTQGLTTTILKAIYPDIHTKLQTKENVATADFKWNYQRTYTMIPRQIYDEDTEEGDHTGADRVLVALWTPKTIKLNMPYNRRQSYESADGDSLNGWNPIIAIQCKPLEGGTGFTRPTLPASADVGVNPGPRIHSSMVTYFTDLW